MKITEKLTLIAVGKLHTEIDDSQYGSMISNLKTKTIHYVPDGAN